MGWVPQGHTFFSHLCKAENAKKGTLEIILGPRVLDLRTPYIWNQSHLGKALSTHIWPHLFLFSCQAKNGTLVRETLEATT